MDNVLDSPDFQLNDKKIINAWALFDWANSSYALVIAVAIFPIYFNEIVADQVKIFGITTSDSALFSYSLTIAYLIIALSLPLLSGIADYGGRRLFFMKFFTTLGGLACISLFFFEEEFFFQNAPIALGLIGFILATIGFAGGQVFYNSFLPLIVTEDRFDSVSAKGFSYGYIGSVILLIINLVIILKPEWFGIKSAGLATRLAFIMVGIWWIGFAQITFRRLPKDPKDRPKKDLLTKGYQELRKVWTALQQQKHTKKFLFSFFCYSAGVQTVLFLASTFASDELKMDATELILIILILQLVAILGAFVFAKVSGIWGNKNAIIIMLFIWIGICFIAYFVQQKLDFYFIAAAVGFVMGGIQSLSRSTYSKLLPENTPDTASYFSFFDVLEKLAVVLGTFSFGFIDQLTGSMRGSILALTIFFIAGLIILLGVKIQPAKV